MSNKQDKATTERHAKTLRELLKRHENKVCADCKRNDPRWASWNLGVFLCIRCSGIHRSMGTHISKVKSVDLDMWTVEQMNSVQKWGNHRANLYWEAHLKAGHVPPDHKMESFIRSKYESRRWALDGPPPSDPAVLEGGAATSEASGPTPPAIPAPSTSSSTTRAPPAARTQTQQLPITRQPRPHQLLSTGIAGRATHAVSSSATPPPPPAAPVQPAAPAAAPAAANDLFTLDFHNPAPPAVQQQQPKKDVKQDILSLFSTPAAAPAPAPASAFGQYASAAVPAQNVWGGAGFAQPQPQAQAQTTSMSMTGPPGAGTAMWGVGSGWAAPAVPAQPNVWGAPAPVQQQQQSLFNTSDVWASTPALGSGAAGGTDLFGSSLPAKKDDAFGDLWGGFK